MTDPTDTDPAAIVPVVALCHYCGEPIFADERRWVDPDLPAGTAVCEPCVKRADDVIRYLARRGSHPCPQGSAPPAAT